MTTNEEARDVNAGPGWYEWLMPGVTTTHIAYVHENGEVYDPENGWNPPMFAGAALEGRAHRLVRADAAPDHQAEAREQAREQVHEQAVRVRGDWESAMVDEALRLGPQYTRPGHMWDRFKRGRQAGAIRGLRPLTNMGKAQEEAFLHAVTMVKDKLLEWPFLPAEDAIWELRRGEQSIFYPLFREDPTIWVECPSGREHLPGKRVTTDHRGECSDCGYDLVTGVLANESTGQEQDR